MSGSTPVNAWNVAYLEALEEAWRRDPESVPATWRSFFAGYRLGREAPAPAPAAAGGRAQSAVASLIYNYRALGHRIARLDPLGENPETHPDLELASFGLSEADLDSFFDTGHLFFGPRRMRLRDILAVLRETYCRTIGVEYVHIQEVQIRRWLQERMESVLNRPRFTAERKRAILAKLIDAEVFERFLHTRYPGQKRFSLEGAEAMIPALQALIERAADMGVEEIVFGLTHRGRLNFLANIMGKSYALIFSEFEDTYVPHTPFGDGDVRYHLGFAADYRSRNGRTVHLSLTPNPSHLEAVGPVVEGRVRAKQRQRGDTEERRRVIPVLVHGDAAFAGQGIVAETLQLSQLKGYRTGGTVHFVINNQIGFTTLPWEGRSSVYATDVAKTVAAPIFHVNGDDPEAVVYVTELALEFRQTFGRDVVVDMYCYRRHGHNEADEPEYTQPRLYEKIRRHPPVRKLYTEQLLREGLLRPEEEDGLEAEFRRKLEEAFAAARKEPPEPVVTVEDGWERFSAPFSVDPVPTGASAELLLEAARRMHAVPEGFRLHPKLRRWAEDRRRRVEAGGPIDWALAEALAFATLLLEGTPVRLSGQDSARGTFSQRHAIWVDQELEEWYIPLNNLRPPGKQARFCVYNSSLSEAAVLGFDFGYSLSEPEMLILWEAQFGDFANGAQVILDQFIVASLSKWNRPSGIVLLLPHGYEGQGPEHSNAYLERYLQAAAEGNIQVVQPTTPANYFHVLRRQVKRPFRRPLIIMTPKSLLRHRECVSSRAELEAGSFQPVLADPEPPERPERVLLMTGKVFYELLARRRQAGGEAVFIRLEELYPFPAEALRAALAPYPEAELVWVQEEPRNRGAWSYVAPRLRELFPGRPLRYVGEEARASPAPGSFRRHRETQARILAAALAPAGRTVTAR